MCVGVGDGVKKKVKLFHRDVFSFNIPSEAERLISSIIGVQIRGPNDK